MVGTLVEENNEAEVHNKRVFYDINLTWGDVARATDVREFIIYTRSKRNSVASTSISRVQKKTPTIQVVSDEDADNNVEELDIGDNGQGGAMDETLDLDGEDDEFDI